MFDENLYSRQLYVVGKNEMNLITKTKVLIHGMTGAGLEIAKCLILAGVKNIFLYDNKKIEEKDLSINYYAQKKNTGEKRAQVVLNNLQELNPNAEIIIIENYDFEYICKNIDIYVQCDDYEKSIEIGDLCNKNMLKYILCLTRGYDGMIFCDFGKKFNVKNIDGEDEKTGIIIGVKNNIITTSEPNMLSYCDNVELEINGEKYIGKVKKIIDIYNFLFEDNNKKEIDVEYTIKSVYREIKKEICFDFKTISESFEEYDENKILLILDEKCGKENKEMFEFNKSQLIQNLDYKKTENMEKSINSVFFPTESFFGSITAQEVLKAITHKFTPINQFMFHKFYDVIDDNKRDINVFIVGAGALGCELIKNCALIGIKNIDITDMDIIEKSNLSRQFLFKNSDIGKFKSECAKEAIINMRKDLNLNITAHKLKVDKTTKSIFNDEFFEKQNIVLSALDNTEARLFVDGLCLEHKKPLLDSGTLGMKCNTQTIIPNLTQTYGSSSDPIEKSIPVCTIKNFPYLINHTIQWGRDIFEGYFKNIAENFVNKKLSDEEEEILKNNIVCEEKDCIIFAKFLWDLLFKKEIVKLQEKFPEDMITEEGIPFWSGTKVFPKVREFNNELDLDFIEATANLWGKMFGYDFNINKKTILELDLKKSEKIINLENIKLYPIEFEKDDEKNYHIEFITYASNLRAENYGIEQTDKLKTKKIAGNIIPAITTTTTLICSLVMFELIKIVNEKKKISNYKNAYINMALSVFCFTEPVETVKKKVGKMEISEWDVIKFDDEKLVDIIAKIEMMTGLEVMVITTGKNNIYNNYISENKKKEKENKTLKMLYEEIIETNVNVTEKSLKICVFFEEEEEKSKEEVGELLCEIIF